MLDSVPASITELDAALYFYTRLRQCFVRAADEIKDEIENE